MTRRVLVTGGGGYIGSVLVGMLLQDGYDVRVVDRFFFGDTLSDLRGDPRLELVRGDVRWVGANVFDGIWAVLDLAALSNDPAGELNPRKTLAINAEGRIRMANMAARSEVERYVLASSCSIYGFQEGTLTEESEPNPLTTYAEANLLAEKGAMDLGGQDLTVTALRQATVYGLSRRMRFDVAVNGMTLGLWRDGEIPVLRDGSQWRPMVHVRDTCRAFLGVLEAPSELVNREVFNIGSDEQNFQILDLARRIADGIGVEFRYRWYGDPDLRSYQVSFRKAADQLGYVTKETPESAAREIADALEAGSVVPDERTKTVEWYSSLLRWREILDDVILDNELL